MLVLEASFSAEPSPQVMMKEPDRPLIAYFGHHKCGSTWISLIIDDICTAAGLTAVHHHYESLFEGDIVALRDREPFDFWRYVNADVNFTRDVDLVGFHVVRDPRDVIVSAYFSHLDSHPDERWPRLRHYRRYLRSLSFRDGLLAEMEFNAIFFAHMLAWDYGRSNILEAKFEDLILDDQGKFRQIFEFLGLVPEPVTVDRLQSIVASRTFVQLSGGRPPGVQDNQSHYRKGQAGDWRNYFEPVHISYFKRLYNPLVLKLGYESYDDWG